MSSLPPTINLKEAIVSQENKRTYGIPSWAFFTLALLVNIGFLISQVVVNGVRSDALAVETLDQWLYPGVYWFFATGAILFLLLSAFILGLTLALLVVRAWLHVAPCRYYGIALGIQLVPWLYFIAALP